MSSSSSSAIAIPKRKQPIRPSHGPSWSSSSSSYQSSVGMGSTPASNSSFTTVSSLNGSPSLPSNLSKAPVGAGVGARERIQPRRPSLLGSSLSKSEYTVVNLGHEDGPPRLVSCIKSSQGFDWNQELFLPSYADHDSDLEHRPDPVHEITLTDEEAAQIFPQ